jgi:hypothetical protein
MKIEGLCRVAADGVNFRSPPSILLSRETEALTNYSTFADADNEYGYQKYVSFSHQALVLSRVSNAWLVLWLKCLVRYLICHLASYASLQWFLIFVWCIVQGDQKVSVHLMITIQKVTSNVQSVPRHSPDIHWHAELCSRRGTLDSH